MPSCEIPWAAWFGDGLFELDFPENCELHVCNFHDAPALTPRQIQQALKSPIATPPLQQLVSKVESVAIAVDDLSRPTPAHTVLPILLEELAAGGIEPDQITFVVSLGSHTALTDGDLRKKLGDDIVDRFRVLNHDCQRDLVDLNYKVGKVSVRLNSAFMAADFKILLGGVTPHAFAGFSGGAKMVLPGLANIESIEWTHKAVLMGLRGRAGTLTENPLRREFERVARQAGANFTIQVVVNSRRQVAGVFAGGLEMAHREAVQFAAKVYATPVVVQADVVVLNAYPKDDELLQAENAFMFHHTAPGNYLKQDGLALVISACSLGMGHHGLFGPNQRLYRTPMRKAFLKHRDMAAFMPGVTKEDFHHIYWEGYPHFDRWERVRAYLAERYPNGARVCVYPCSSIQIAARAE